MTETIGQRAVQAIMESAARKGICVTRELEALDTTRATYCGWRDKGRQPSAYFLQQMALAGYDVYWILTGVRAKQDSQWVSVQERLPKPFESVCVCMPDEAPLPTVREGYWTECGFMVPALFQHVPATHWMPLPEPPKEV